MTEKLTQTARLKNLEEAVLKIIEVAKKDALSLGVHIRTPDAHNPAVMSDKVKQKP